MWRFILTAALFISSGFSSAPIRGFKCSNGLIQSDVWCLDKIPTYQDCPVPEPTFGACMISSRYCSATELIGDIPNSSLATFGCRTGFTYNEAQSVCIRKEDRGAPVMGCAPECYRRNGQCMRTTPADYVCDRDRPHPNCLPRTLRNRSSCPPEYEKFAKTNCWWTGEENIICHDKIKVDELTARCFTNEACPESQHCQVGNLENGRCMETVRRSREWLCQNSTTLRFRCLYGERNTENVCKAMQEVEDETICPDNYDKIPGGICVSRSTTPATRLS